MADPRKPAARVVKIETTKGREYLTIRKQDGTTETVITSASTSGSISHAIKSIPRTLKSLADK